MYPPNILITNYCNQDCSFCFAASEMSNQRIQKEMSLKDFKTVLLKMKKDPKRKIVKLLGGEPTLHSQFKEIINLSLHYFPKVQVFTDGIFSDSLADFLEKKGEKVNFTFNVMTPGFLFNPKIRNLVSKRISQLADKTLITLSFTFDMNSDMDLVFQSLRPKILRLVHGFRLGFSNPIACENNFYRLSDFPKMGKQLVFVVKTLRKHNKKARIDLNCGFTRCMFTKQEYQFIKKQANIFGFGCFGKRASFDLQTDLTAFHCFPLSSINKINTIRKSFRNIYKNLIKKRLEYWSKIRLRACLKCPYYGIGEDNCPGPCLAFRINNLRSVTST